MLFIPQEFFNFRVAVGDYADGAAAGGHVEHAHLVIRSEFDLTIPVFHIEALFLLLSLLL